MKACPDCSKTLLDALSTKSSGVCDECSGTGNTMGLMDAIIEGNTPWETDNDYTCDACDGSGECPTCDGSGEVDGEEEDDDDEA